jgi:hypothetical protein
MFIVPGRKPFKSTVESKSLKSVAPSTATRAELESLAARQGWQPRELTMKDIREMSSAELRYHEVCNRQNYDAAFQRAENVTHNRKAMEQWATKRMFDDQATPQEIEAAVKEAQRFSANHSQFLGSTQPTNRAKLFQWLRDRNLPITYDNFCGGFADLAIRGELVVSAGCIGDGRELTGEALRNYPRLHELLQPHRIPTAEESMSADEWKAAHPELADRRVPPLIARRQQVAEKTAEHFQRSASAEVKASVVRVVDYGEQRPGVPPEADKYSLKQKIRSMSAAELAQRCADDSAFKKAMDEPK